MLMRLRSLAGASGGVGDAGMFLDQTEASHTPATARDLGKRFGLQPPGGPHRVGHYAVYDELARGGMASVHLGRVLPPGKARTVAIKRLHRELTWNPKYVAMFIDEARLGARVRHPNVLAPSDMVLGDDGSLSLVMEYLEGETLADLLSFSAERRMAPSPALAVTIMVSALRGLHAVHEAKGENGQALEIVHRDVSPQNIMIGVDGVARVLDLGVAKSRIQERLPGDDELKGKPAYLSPEQIRGEPVDRRADLFAAGVVLWELLAQKRLFRHGDAHVAWLKILTGEILPPSRHNPEVPPALDAVAMKAIERDPSRRFATGNELAAALEQALPAASCAEVARWLQHVCGLRLATRARKVAAMIEGESRAAQERPVATGKRRWVLTDALVGVLGMALLVTRPMACGGPFAALGSMMEAKSAPVVVAMLPPEKIVKAADLSEDLVEEEPSEEGLEAEVEAAVEAPVEPAVDAAPATQPLARADQPTRPVVTIRPRRASPAVARITALNERAIEAYQRLQFPAARRLLGAALALCGRDASDRSCAVTHAYLGLVLAGGLEQRQRGIGEFQKALAIDPRVRLPRKFMRFDVAEAFEDATAR